ncbi:exodeoxyribonuclease VII small subunit [Bacteroidales bacterium OttesenSCG-928-B11]|nr:exodeoxyribonuclease VII small subunit [Bacteroidales bacterium OttesenSCG-928-B11]MDL2325780.1 exodeoxyribonuclease VII small subunit [Bacteroidales bacterium OttesenSCG-928-A14]
MSTKKENLTYSEAFDELQTIVKKMENADISVDELSEKIKRASFLIKLCKDKLTKTEKEIKEIMSEEQA